MHPWDINSDTAIATSSPTSVLHCLYIRSRGVWWQFPLIPFSLFFYIQSHLPMQIPSLVPLPIRHFIPLSLRRVQWL